VIVVFWLADTNVQILKLYESMPLGLMCDRVQELLVVDLHLAERAEISAFLLAGEDHPCSASSQGSKGIGKGECFYCTSDSRRLFSMAFVGAISDLFSCGKPRRPQTRDGANPGADVTRTDATPNDAQDKIAVDTAAPHLATLPPVHEDSFLQFESLGSKGPGDTLAQSICEPTAAQAPRQPEEAHAESPEVPQSRTRCLESSNEKAKTSSGWQVEQRILVTTSAADTSDAPFKPSLDLIEASVVDVTPVLKAQHVTPTPPVKKEEVKVENIEEVVAPPAVAELEVAVEKEEPRVEEVEQAVTPQTVIEPKVVEHVPSTREPAIVPESKEASPVAVSEEVSHVPVPMEAESIKQQPAPSAPKQFLDLPIGMYPPPNQSIQVS
jgi:hypothetical protein